jgi:hypothetical protein
MTGVGPIGQCKAKNKPKLWSITSQPINNGLMDPCLGAEMFIESSAMDSAAYLTSHASVNQFVCEAWQINKRIQP